MKQAVGLIATSVGIAGLVAIFLGITMSLLAVEPSLPSQEAVAAPAHEGLDIGALERQAATNEVPSFDEHYQRYIGVLDVLRSYPEP